MNGNEFQKLSDRADVFPRDVLARSLFLLWRGKGMSHLAGRVGDILAQEPLPNAAELGGEPDCFRVDLPLREVDEIIDYLGACEGAAGAVDAAEADRISSLVDAWLSLFIKLKEAD